MGVWVQVHEQKEKLSLNRPWRPIGLWDIEAPHFLDNRLTDGGGVVSLMLWPHLHYQEDSWYSFVVLSQAQGHSAAARIRSLENSNYLVWS
jgi:hypothetical protein